jgi:hypothetical protein
MDHESFEGLVPIVAIMVPIIISLGAFIMVIFLRKYANEERMSLISKGLNPKDFQTDRPPVDLRYALVAIGAGIGLLVGNVLEATTGINEEVAYFSMLLLFGGLGLVTAYLIQQKKQDKTGL